MKNTPTRRPVRTRQKMNAEFSLWFHRHFEDSLNITHQQMH